MCAGSCKIRGATHAAPNSDAISPEYEVSDTIPLGLISINGLEQSLPNIEVRSFGDAVGA